MASILGRQRLALQFPVPTRIFLRSASNDNAPSLMVAMMAPPVMLRQIHTFLKLLINFL